MKRIIYAITFAIASSLAFSACTEEEVYSTEPMESMPPSSGGGDSPDPWDSQPFDASQNGD